MTEKTQAKEPEVELEMVSRPDEMSPEVAAYVDQVEQSLARTGAELEQANIPEARGIVFGDLWGVATDSEGVKHEIKFNVTCRSFVSGAAALQDYISMLTLAKSFHIYPYLPTPLSSGRTQAKQQAQAPAATTPQAPGAPAAPSAPSGGNGSKDDEVKSAKVKKIIVEKPGTVKVYYTDQYAVQSHIGAEGISKFFDPELGWKPEHFQQPAIYPEEQVSNLTMEWKKNDKGYNDIQRIYAG